MDAYFLNGDITIVKRVLAFGVGVISLVLVFVSDPDSYSSQPGMDGIFANAKAHFAYSLGNRELLNDLALEKDKRQTDNPATQARAEITNPGFRRRMVIVFVIAMMVIIAAIKLLGYL